MIKGPGFVTIEPCGLSFISVSSGGGKGVEDRFEFSGCKALLDIFFSCVILSAKCRASIGEKEASLLLLSPNKNN